MYFCTSKASKKAGLCESPCLFTCFTCTKVQILTPEELQRVEAHEKKLEQQLTDAQAEGRRLQALAGVCKASKEAEGKRQHQVLSVFVLCTSKASKEAAGKRQHLPALAAYKSPCFTSTKVLALLAQQARALLVHTCVQVCARRAWSVRASSRMRTYADYFCTSKVSKEAHTCSHAPCAPRTRLAHTWCARRAWSVRASSRMRTYADVC